MVSKKEAKDEIRDLEMQEADEDAPPLLVGSYFIDNNVSVVSLGTRTVVMSRVVLE